MPRRARPFRLRAGVVEIALEPVVREELRMAAEIVLGLLEPGHDDLFPASGPVAEPEDPAIARLLPAAYDDDAAAAEFRRLTDGELRALKRSDATALRDHAAAETIEPGIAEQWLRALNDARLILASRLEIQEDGDAEDLMQRAQQPGAEGLAAAVIGAYVDLGYLQELLIEALDG